MRRFSAKSDTSYLSSETVAASQGVILKIPTKKKNPPKKQKTIMSSSRTPGKTGSSQLTESAQPGDGGKRSNVGGATGSQGKTGCRQLTESTQPGGATGRTKSVAAWPDPDDEVRFSQPSGGEGSNLGGATGSQSGFLHHFTVKFSRTDCNEYAINCDEPCTVLEAIQSTEQYWKMKTRPDENIVIQLGKKDKKYTIATHFPCSCIGEGESLVISFGPKKVEVAQDQLYRPIQSRDKYFVFYIDTIGGKKPKTKKLFRNNVVKEFKYLCVYEEKGITVIEALERDGRFVDKLGNFTLTYNNNSNRITKRIQKVGNLVKKTFKLCLPRNKRANDSSSLSSNSPQRSDSTPAVDEAQQRKIRAAIEKSGNNANIKEVYEALRRQFPDLNKCMESRFPGNSEALNLRKENFGKIEQSFSEVHRVRKLLKLGESVCKVTVENGSQGTGFVLFDKFILTNAHLFEGCVEGQKLKEGIDVCVKFEDPESKEYYFKLAHPKIFYVLGDPDYAVLEIMPVGENYNYKTKEITNTIVPPGLLKSFGPKPQNGEACIIGHPNGGVKKMDPTFIIEKNYEDYLFTLCAINHAIKNDPHADSLVYYNTFMNHGSSGSPVFDAQGNVFGLHTGCFPKSEPTVIEFAQPLLTIFEHFVSMLKVNEMDELLERVNKEVKGNVDLEKIFMSVVEESMDTD